MAKTPKLTSQSFIIVAIAILIPVLSIGFAAYHFGFILLLNAFWFLFFFGLHEPMIALIAISAVFIVLLITIRWFKVVSVLSAYLLIPYAVWVLFLIVFTFEFWRIN